ncbi:PaaI family thioesterase [Nocardia testacea]|uniref:PaaI family thioesterase n=1 Tax=Nocardia testacea TaxID=248551 RepID=UPI000316A38B|nr:hotdog domain-containing protein [Nocardia testacea]
MTVDTGTAPRRRHILLELGFATTRAGDELHGAATITPQMYVPGTERLRTSVLATWTDTVTGLLAALTLGPRVPVTLELDVHLYRPAPGSGEVRAVGRKIKAGRSVFVAEVEWTVDGEPFAFGGGSFMVSPDADLRLPAGLSVDMPVSDRLLEVPLAERAGCVRRAPGTAVLPRTDDGLNASRTVNGGLIALAAEEAILSLAPGATLSTLGLRYLQPARVGPVVADATLRAEVGRATLRDTGNSDRITTLATGRLFPA